MSLRLSVSVGPPVLSISRLLIGSAVPMPTRSVLASIERVLESKFKASAAAFKVTSTVWLERSITPVLIAKLPVVEPPSVKVWALVVPRLPKPVRKAALLPELAEIVAVGVPELTLMKPNLAEAVAVLPIKTSRVSFMGDKAPSLRRQ